MTLSYPPSNENLRFIFLHGCKMQVKYLPPPLPQPCRLLGTVSHHWLLTLHITFNHLIFLLQLLCDRVSTVFFFFLPPAHYGTDITRAKRGHTLTGWDPIMGKTRAGLLGKLKAVLKWSHDYTLRGMKMFTFLKII